MMRSAARLLLIALVAAPLVFEAQVRPAKPAVRSKARSTRVSVGGGLTRSVLFLARNTRSHNDANGVNINASYGISRMVRVNAEYTNYRTIQIAPTWYDVNAHTWEANVHFISKFQDSHTYFYPLFGLSYNVFSGHFTGVNDFLNLSVIYKVDQRVVTRWGGFNAGVGLEHFFAPLSVFGECKMRVGVSEGYNELTIMDVCYSAGLRFNMRARSAHGIFGGTRSRYMLDTRDNDW